MKNDYPSSPVCDTKEEWFGRTLPDPYAWLKDGKDPAVLDWVRQQNEFTDAFFPALPVREKMAALKKEKLSPLPGMLSPCGRGLIGTVYEDGNYQVMYLDENCAPTGKFTPPEALKDRLLFQADPCPKVPGIYALMTQLPGASRPNLTVVDQSTGTVLLDAAMVFSFGWSRENGRLYYSSSETDPRAQTSHSVFFSFDPAGQTTEKVYEDDSPAIFGQVYPSSDGVYILAMVCQDYSRAQWIAIDARTGGTAKLTRDCVEWTYMDSIGGTHYFITLSEAARGAVIAVSPDGERKVVLPESDTLILEKGFSVRGRLFALAREHVSARLIDVDTGRPLPLPSAFGALNLTGRDRHDVFFTFESFLDAPRIMRFDGESLRTVCVSGGKRHDDLTVEQLFAPSADGTPIPYYLVHRRDAERNGDQPVLAYAYGGYNLSMPPSYTEAVTQTAISRWVENGGVFVQINNRGGNEYGPSWHEGGMGLQKRHCYEDFIGVIEQLIRDGWTKKGRVGICGCSNGGLLMSALVTMRPDLWGAVIDSVPHTDMIHFAQDDRGPMYITEYGNPRESKEVFEYLLSYSPYHNVRSVPYPPTYIQTGELDNNVPPYHGKKLAARMQAKTTGDAPILLRVLAEGSHDRGKGEVFWQTAAEMQCFLEKYLLR